MCTPDSATKKNDTDKCEYDFLIDDMGPLSEAPTPSEISGLECGEVGSTSTKSMVKVHLNRHQSYWFDDGNLFIRVANVDFKIHRYFFKRDSATFRKLSNEGEIGRIPFEADEEHPTYLTPLVLTGITSVDFERFLSVLYPKNFNIDSGSSSEHWASILKVSDYLAFNSVRNLSVEKLTKVATPIEKIALGRQFKINHWLREAYRATCTRKETLTKAEGQRVGVDEVVGIMEARQIFLWEKPKLKADEQNPILSRIFGVN